MSFNLRYGLAKDGENSWPNRKNLVVETIRANKPQILGTQECLLFQMQFLAENLPDYDHAGRSRDDNKAGERCELFWARERFDAVETGSFMLSPTPNKHGSRGWDAALPRIASWAKLKDRGSGSVVFVLNTHFDHKGATARLESAALVRKLSEQLAGELPIICMGDMNFGPAFAGYDTLSKAPWQDTFRMANPKPAAEEGTFNGFQNRLNGSRIDFIFTRDLVIKDAKIDRTARDGKTPSDHFPVVALLKIQP